jgi:N-sulfoglucosamine sulfohydrolase
MRRPLLFALFLLPLLRLPTNTAAAPASASATPQGRPNIVIFIADDLCWYDVACFGGPTSARTPNLDRLASEGIKLTGFYSSTTVCAPTRQALLTGLSPVRSGAYPNHSTVRAGTKSLPTHLKALGYRSARIGKLHFGPPESFPFDIKDKDARRTSSKQGGAGEEDVGDLNLPAFDKFASQSPAPFFAYLASHEPHVPFTKGKPALHDPKTFVLAPYLPDTEETRKQLQGYYAEIDVLDQQVGEVMRILERTEKAENTLLLFVSEQGAVWPFSKWTLHNPGIRVAAIARWPGHITPGSQSAALLQYEDVVPTVLEAAGGDPARIDAGCPDALGNTGLDGRSALDVLTGRTRKLRDVVFGQNTMLGISGVNSPYASRMACTGDWKLIVNYHADQWNPRRGYGLARNWITEGEKGNAFAAAQAQRLARKPTLELYDLQKDPWELKSVAELPEHRERIQKLRAQLELWLKQQGDDPVQTENAAHEHQPGHQKKLGPTE